jgi:glucose/arabinose dehydrogenase
MTTFRIPGGSVSRLGRAALALLFLLLLSQEDAALAGAEGPGQDLQVTPLQVFPGLTFSLPLYVGNAADGSKRLFVVEQDGAIYLIHPETGRRSLVLDLTGIVHHPRSGYTEEGLLALAFHPDFKNHPFLYVWYCIDSPRRTVLARYTMDATHPDQADPTSEVRLLLVEQPFTNHKGSTLLFGPDGYLYVSLGDGGSGGDPYHHGQDLGVLLGKILRLDVDHAQPPLAYAIPADNPFVGQAGARGEIWAYGLRNVWRMSMDRSTHELWAGDVGQDLWEEVDLITRGGNYGWNVREGTHAYKGQDPIPGLIEPVIDYGHDVGRSIIGGYVYRGAQFPALQGWYLYGDFVSGRIWALKRVGTSVAANRLVAESHLQLTSFGEDEAGELYMTAFDGHLYQLTTP